MSDSGDDNSVTVSIVQYLSPANSGSCGYCKRGKKKPDGTPAVVNVPPLENEEPSYSLGVIAHFLTCEDFNRMLDIGWNRSGKYLYKPIMDRTCCPQYTIRLDVHRFRMSRTHKRVLKNMHNFLKYGKRPERTIADPTQHPSAPTTAPKPDSASSRGEPRPVPVRPERGIKKKEFRRQRAVDRLRAKGENVFEYQRQRRIKEESRRRTIQSFIEPYVEGEWAHKLEIRMIQKGSPEFERSFEESYALFVKYQSSIHEDANTSRKGYEGFLMSSPLITKPADRSIQPVLGSYHQQYILDGRIIAVGVIDLLPRCLSSKYFYYDPDFSFLTMGTYSALREIAFTQGLAVNRPDLHYYYMGYYLQECPKMRYKGRFHPSDLLCDQTFKWMPLEQAVAKIVANNSKFTVFYPNDPRPPGPSLAAIRVMLKDKIRRYPSLRHELTGQKLLEFDENMSELIYYMHTTIESVVIFFPHMTTDVPDDGMQDLYGDSDNS
uniref:Arginyl-tRNA--protein transferase 1 n=1 Tax=Panagrellus redivivus TaxID=6233 RepID=A0A7E4VH43_PANRE